MRDLQNDMKQGFELAHGVEDRMTRRDEQTELLYNLSLEVLLEMSKLDEFGYIRGFTVHSLMVGDKIKSGNKSTLIEEILTDQVWYRSRSSKIVYCHEQIDRDNIDLPEGYVAGSSPMTFFVVEGGAYVPSNTVRTSAYKNRITNKNVGRLFEAYLDTITPRLSLHVSLPLLSTTFCSILDIKLETLVNSMSPSMLYSVLRHSNIPIKNKDILF